MIVIEGMDNTGKTTLAEKLAKYLKLPVTHSPSELAGTSALIEWAQGELGSKKLYDRFPLISEKVYGPVLRGGYCDFDESWVEQYKPRIIYCRPPREKILDFKDREQMSGVILNAGRLIDQYDRVMRELADKGRGVMVYDYTQIGDYNKVVNYVEREFLW